MSAAIRGEVRSDLVRLANRHLSLHELARRAATTLQRAVRSDGICLLTLDPATLLPTGEFVENGLPPDTRARLGEIEHGESDYNMFVDLARSPVPAASLSAATGGELDRSRRQRELRAPSGFADELRATLGDDTGTWAALTLLREKGRPRFTEAEVTFVASITRTLADAVRRALLTTSTTPEAIGEPGLVVLSPDDTVDLADRRGEHWLEVLADDGADLLPVVVRAVAERARRDDGDRPPTARVRTARGDWVVVRGSRLGDGASVPVAVHFETAGAPELAPLLVAAYGLTAREHEITELVARGHSTNEIAARLDVAAYTVQDHLKSVFAKTDSASRGELVARLFLDHHLARFMPIEPDRGGDRGPPDA